MMSMDSLQRPESVLSTNCDARGVRANLQGDSTIAHDLLRAGVRQAKYAIIMSNSASSRDDGSFMTDARTILSFMTITQLSPSIIVRVELAVAKNHNLFDPEMMQAEFSRRIDRRRARSDRYVQAQLLPSFAEGTIITSALMEALLAQAHQNPFTVSFIKRLIYTDQLSLVPVPPALYVRWCHPRKHPRKHKEAHLHSLV